MSGAKLKETGVESVVGQPSRLVTRVIASAEAASIIEQWPYIEKVELYLDQISEPEYVAEKGLGNNAASASSFDQCCIDLSEEGGA